MEAVMRVAERPAAEIVKNLVAAIHAWCGERPEHDDLTLVVARVR